MKQLFRAFLFFVLLLAVIPAAAKVWAAEDLEMVHLESARRWVCNPDGELSSSTVDSIDALLSAMYEEKGVQTVMVVVKQVQDGDCYTFGMDLSRKYGIGQKGSNSGLIIVLSTEDRRYQILTGTGLEGTLPDAICKRVENKIMVPLLKEEKWDEAMLAATRAIKNYIDGDDTLAKDEADEDEDSSSAIGILLFFVVFFIVVYLVLRSRSQRCPCCGKHGLRATTRTFLYTRDDWDYYRVVYVCSHCRYSETKIERMPHQDNDNMMGPIIGGSILGSSLGRGGGFGGGFGGGSFGGGGFGGGGAGGGF